MPIICTLSSIRSPSLGFVMFTISVVLGRSTWCLDTIGPIVIAIISGGTIRFIIRIEYTTIITKSSKISFAETAVLV